MSGHEDQPASDLLHALVEEATRKSAIVWLRYPGVDRARPAWHVWHDGAAYVVAGGAEQPLPGLPDAGEVTVTCRTKDGGARLVSWTARAERVEPGTPEWDAAVGALRAARLNAVDAEHLLDRWAAESTVVRLAPTGEVLEQPGRMPDDEDAAPPPDSPATTRGRLPWVVHKRPRTGPRLS